MIQTDCPTCGESADFRTMDRLEQCPHCGEFPFDLRRCAKCSREEHVQAGQFVAYDRDYGVPAWVCSACCAEEEKLRPYLRGWVPMAAILLILVVGVLVVEAIAVGLVTLWNVLF
ncbi:MAG: hypothetical protein IBX71_05455 [Candidatus Desulforudis sp.]|nr:hypothetical protein [Desulforudis sp.]